MYLRLNFALCGFIYINKNIFIYIALEVCPFFFLKQEIIKEVYRNEHQNILKSERIK